MNHKIRKAISQEPPMQASKWLKLPVLLDSDEMKDLLNYLNGFSIYLVSCVCNNEDPIPKELFFNCYSRYVSELKQGKLLPESEYRHLFSSIFTVSSDELYVMDAGEGKKLIRVCKPVIQLQAHKISHSDADGKFHSMTFGTENISWGIQFSYPQLFQNPSSGEIQVIDAKFPNTKLFQSLQKWIREYTNPTPIIVNDRLINIPVRLGKKCFSWINQHPQLINKNLRVKT